MFAEFVARWMMTTIDVKQLSNVDVGYNRSSAQPDVGDVAFYAELHVTTDEAHQLIKFTHSPAPLPHLQ